MVTQVQNKQAFAYAELLEILSYMEKQDVEKIPQKLINIFKNNALTEYVPHLDVTIPLEEQRISEETSALLALLTLNYWCESEEQKKELLEIYATNEKNYQEELRKKYNPNAIFSSESNPLSSEGTTQIESSLSTTNASDLPVDYNSFTWYKKLFTKVRNFIYKFFKREKFEH